MRLLYIVPTIKNADGVARVLSIKANYFIEHFNYEVHILSQNENTELPFYDFNSKVVFHSIELKRNAFRFLKFYQKQINQKVKKINPDVILVADNGLKAFAFPFLISTKRPIILECHSSKFIEEKQLKSNFLSKLVSRIKYHFKDFGAQKFTQVVVLSNENLNEWNVKNAVVIPNSSWVKTEETASLQNKKVIAIARNSYEKGLDQLLPIWAKVNEKHSDWVLDIYTNEIDSLKKEVVRLGLSSVVNFFPFQKNIERIYREASIYVITSRFEAFSMTLVEAMSFGLPCIAFDGPAGPRSIINNETNGFLVPDGNIALFAEKISVLIENENLRKQLGSNAKESMQLYEIDAVMEKWKKLLESL
ncbi:glycosyltransferase family 4 protein [Flavobacterium sp. FlaQc-30]|uniref:glycosyltransferase family 4 protein n=1 Tax=Flavobacterium sp. FlaQc-30 TaxID=3374179 RepID=UPI003757ECD7